MAQVIAIAEGMSTFRQVEEKLGLRLAEDPQFFPEWMEVAIALTDVEQARLEQVRRNYPPI
jgi:hypothetical protein